MQGNQKHIIRLLQACKNQDQIAQLEIYKLYYKAMYNTAYRITCNSFEAEDMMQESFLIAFTKLDSFKGEVSFGAWLKRIVINKCLTQIKKNSRIEEVKLELVEYKLIDEESDFEDEDYSMIKVKEIINVMERLKNNYRIALTLSLVEGYDNEEVAEIMNISNENCRTTISRAKNKLRKMLKESNLVN